jgi:importin subunit alpha-6/7
LIHNFFSSRIQHESVWILINVAFGSSEKSFSIIQAGGVPKLIRLMNSQDWQLANQATWVISNLCGEGTIFRDMILMNGAVDLLCVLLTKPNLEVKLLKSLVWLSLNITRHSAIPYEAVSQLFQPLLNLFTFDDRRVVVDCCWFFTNYVDHNPLVRNQVLLKLLVEFDKLLANESSPIVEAAARFVYTVVTRRRYKHQNYLIFETEMVSKLVGLMTNNKVTIARLATFCCKQLADTLTANQIQSLLDNNALESLTRLFEEDIFTWKTKREAIGVMTNLIARGTQPQLRLVIDNTRLLIALFKLMESQQVELVEGTLKLLDRMKDLPLQHFFMDFPSLKRHMTECGLDVILQNILDHVSDNVHEYAYELMLEIYPENVSLIPLSFNCKNNFSCLINHKLPFGTVNGISEEFGDNEE